MSELNILIAEDEEMLCELYQLIIESEFTCKITIVHDGESAINLIKNNSNFDLIISDFNMPKANGGELFLANKNLNNIPFFLFSGGEISDYKDFKDFKEINALNYFFNKPFDDTNLINSINEIVKSKSKDLNSADKGFIKIKLAYYIMYTKKTAEVYIKLSDNKYTKILNNSTENEPDHNVLEHYKSKGIEYIYLQETSYKNFIDDVFNKFKESSLSQKKVETILKIAGFDLSVCIEGLKDIGISPNLIENTNNEIHDSILAICTNPKSKDEFAKLCETQGMIISHSSLIIYIAAAICKHTNLSFSSTMRKISIAAFYHDLSLFTDNVHFDENKIKDIKDDKFLKIIMKHPMESASLLPLHLDPTDDTKKIILEHHELPNGSGYPKGLNVFQISQLSCLFIISQEIALCLIRNNFSLERLNDFLNSSEKDYNQGNFSKFYVAAQSTFSTLVKNDKEI